MVRNKQQFTKALHSGNTVNCYDDAGTFHSVQVSMAYSSRAQVVLKSL